MDIETMAREAVDCGFQVHTELGPGMLESVYEIVLAKYLVKRGFRVERQRSISFTLDDTEFTDAFRADLVIEDLLLIEVKSLEKTLPVHVRQLLTYLRVMKRPLGFVMNFGTATFKEGVRRSRHWDCRTRSTACACSPSARSMIPSSPADSMP